MKKLLVIVGLMFMGVSARAQQLMRADSVNSVAPYSQSCSSTTVGQVQADLTGNTSSALTTAAVTHLTIQNLSSGTTVYFSSDPNVTTSTASATGFAIYPITSTNAALPNFKEFVINAMQKFYGVAGSNGSPIEVCKLR